MIKCITEVAVVFVLDVAKSYQHKNQDGNLAGIRKNPHVIDVGSKQGIMLN
jgi:hypothetical protein